mmetsp:Transcript_44697/g.145236  ORF Transcript_44697/g.145236 Transcript_44697/m.145236 type:complete len:212 (-) Transcript_44697:1938-2573(-)
MRARPMLLRRRVGARGAAPARRGGGGPAVGVRRLSLVEACVRVVALARAREPHDVLLHEPHHLGAARLLVGRAHRLAPKRRTVRTANLLGSEGGKARAVAVGGAGCDKGEGETAAQVGWPTRPAGPEVRRSVLLLRPRRGGRCCAEQLRDRAAVAKRVNRATHNPGATAAAHSRRVLRGKRAAAARVGRQHVRVEHAQLRVGGCLPHAQAC